MYWFYPGALTEWGVSPFNAAWLSSCSCLIMYTTSAWCTGSTQEHRHNGMAVLLMLPGCEVGSCSYLIMYSTSA